MLKYKLRFVLCVMISLFQVLSVEVTYLVFLIFGCAVAANLPNTPPKKKYKHKQKDNLLGNLYKINI